MSSIISVSNLSKAYRIGKKADRADSFVGMLQDSVTAPFRNWRKMRDLGGAQRDAEDELHWALRDVSFEVKEGEVLGVIGRNGAGKSTLLKILSRITEPTSGEVKIRGRVASLLEVGTGFHPELTGRENVYLNGTILGMHKREIDRKFDEIVNFSGVEKFLDTPVKRYSSGMRVRLAFAVAAYLDPEILIVDEVLAVGDTEFQRKCMGRMKEVSTGLGKTVIFVSHNMMAIQSLCKSALLMQNGCLIQFGKTEEIIDLYADAFIKEKSQTWKRPEGLARESNAFIDYVSIETEGNQPDIKLIIHCQIKSTGNHPGAFLAINIHNSRGDWIMQAIPSHESVISASSKQAVLIIEVAIPPLIPGLYPVGIWIGSSYSQTLDWVREVVHFEILDSPIPGRTAPHSPDRGFCVPKSIITKNTQN